MSKNLSRREFLKGAAAGAVGVASAGLLGACATAATEEAATAPVATPQVITETVVEKKVFNEPAKWDYETDVVVIGTGTSMYGVAKLAESGLDVIAIDAYPTLGGSAGFSGAVLWLPNNPKAQERGDSKELSKKYIAQGSNYSNVEDELVDAFLDNVGPMLEFMDPLMENSQYGLKYCISPELGDYHPHWEGGIVEGRSVDWRPGGDNVNYNRSATNWRLAYLEIAEQLGVQLMASTKMTEFVYRFGDDGIPEVLGIIAEQDGKKVAMKANKAVLFAPGGFEWNWDMQRDFTTVVDAFACSTSTNDGTAFKAVQALGPELTNMCYQFGIVCYEEKAKEQRENGAPANIVFEHHNPHVIMVNMDGRRFMNEAADYATQNRQFGHVNTYGDNLLTNVPAWTVCDQQAVEAGFPNGAFEGDVDERGIFPYFIGADTLEELADKIGVNKEKFLGEIERFNGFVEKGHDDDFYRGDSAFDRIFFQRNVKTTEDNVYRTLGKIEKPPFYAGKVAPCTLGTCGGPRINGKAQIKHISGNVIKRLYGCGNGTGAGGPGKAYGGAGGTLGIGFTCGYIAANTIIESEKEDWA